MFLFLLFRHYKAAVRYMGALLFSCSRSLNNPSITSSLNSSGVSAKLRVFSVSHKLFSSSFCFFFARVNRFIKKLNSLIRSDTLSNSQFLVPHIHRIPKHALTEFYQNLIKFCKCIYGIEGREIYTPLNFVL